MGIDELIRQEGREIGVQEGREIGVQEGREIGVQEGRHDMQRILVENLLKGTEFSDDKIASLANVTIEFVAEARRGMK